MSFLAYAKASHQSSVHAFTSSSTTSTPPCTHQRLQQSSSPTRNCNHLSSFVFSLRSPQPCLVSLFDLSRAIEDPTPGDVFTYSAITGWMFLFAVLYAAALLFGMVFFVSWVLGPLQWGCLVDLLSCPDYHVLGPRERLHKPHRFLQQA